METRLAYLWCYLVLEGLGATLVFAGLLPAMLEVGAKSGTRFRLRLFLPTKQNANERLVPGVLTTFVCCQTGHEDESATNLISTIFGSFGNLGGIVGPAIGAPLLSMGGFRLAIATWGVVALFSAVLLGSMVWLTGRCCPLGVKRSSPRYSTVSNNDDEEPLQTD